MKLNIQGLAFTVGFLTAILIAGCEQQPPKTEAPPPVMCASSTEPAQPQPPRPQPAPADQPLDGAAADAQEKPANPHQAPDGQKPAQPPSSGQPANPHAAQPANPHQAAPATPAAKIEGNQLIHGGITMTVPAAWKKADTGPATPMGPKAIFNIPGEGDAVAVVRITHFPEMKGKQMDDMNIDRWLGQVTKADGSPTKREEAKVETKEKDGVRVVIVDAKGTVKATMRDTAQPDGRLIAAIIDHPAGPHFVVAAGPAAIMDKAAGDVLAFIESATVAK